MKRRAFLPLLAAAVCFGQPVPAKKPKLTLAIVIDQFRYDYLTRFRASYTGGLAMLLTKGAVFTNAHYKHFPTVTAVGHSTILSGATPSVSGIIGNEWYDRDAAKQVTSVSDDSARLLGAPGRASSPNRMLVSTLGDELKMSGRASRVIGVSIKDRSAILPAGRAADGAFWFDLETGNFVSSTHYFAELPKWVQEFNQQRVAEKWLGAEWKSLADGSVFKKMDSTAGKPYYNALERTPYGNDLLELFAERAIKGESLGKHNDTDVLSVSFSANDYIGHNLGPDAPEVRDVSIQTDRLLEKFLRFIDAEIGLANTVVVLTADHGVAPLPEILAKRKMPGGRVLEDDIHKRIEAALVEKYGEGKWIVGKSGPAPYLNRDLIRQKGLALRDVQQSAAEAARAIPHVARVYTSTQLSEGRAPEDRADQRILNGFNAKRAPDLTIVLEPYYIYEKTGASHGSPYNYDSHVPIIFMGPGIQAGYYHRRIAVNDIAPTLADLLEVETPSGASGRVLDEIFTRGDR